jgi:diadenylate cyclase
MKKPKSNKARSLALLESALSFAQATGIGRAMIVTHKPLPWEALGNLPPVPPMLLALSAKLRNVPALKKVDTMIVDLPDTSPMEWLEICLQKALKEGHLKRGERLLCVYPLSAPFDLDSMSVIQLKEKTEYVSLQKLDKLSDEIPVNVLSAVVDIAMELAREGREGKPIGSIFVVGDAQFVMESSRPMILNPFQGYPEDQRMITDPNLSETVKEISQIDGAFVIRYNGVILSAGRYLDTPAKGVRLPKGLGSRHVAAAAISRATRAIAVTVSASTRTVRIFRKGKIVLESKPLRGLWI